jgi:hypothetical protein
VYNADRDIINDHKTERSLNEFLQSKIIIEATKSGFFRPEKIPEISKRVKRLYHIYAPPQDIFSYDDTLSVTEKRNLGLNLGMEVSREMIDFMTSSGIKQPNVKTIIQDYYIIHSTIIMNNFHLMRYKKEGISYIRITCVHDEKDCAASQDVNGKIYPMEKVPRLPLPGCKAPFCRCTYSPVSSEEYMQLGEENPP